MPPSSSFVMVTVMLVTAPNAAPVVLLSDRTTVSSGSTSLSGVAEKVMSRDALVAVSPCEGARAADAAVGVGRRRSAGDRVVDRRRAVGAVGPLDRQVHRRRGDIGLGDRRGRRGEVDRTGAPTAPLIGVATTAPTASTATPSPAISMCRRPSTASLQFPVSVARVCSVLPVSGPPRTCEPAPRTARRPPMPCPHPTAGRPRSAVDLGREGGCPNRPVPSDRFASSFARYRRVTLGNHVAIHLPPSLRLSYGRER